MNFNSEGSSILVISLIKISFPAGCWWLMPVIWATQYAEIRRITVWNQPRQIVCKSLSWKKKPHKKGLVEWLIVLRYRSWIQAPVLQRNFISSPHWLQEGCECIEKKRDVQVMEWMSEDQNLGNTSWFK
jgi:hypothetical protein